MTVAELIAELQTFLPDTLVYIRTGSSASAGDFSVIVEGSVTTASPLAPQR